MHTSEFVHWELCEGGNVPEKAFRFTQNDAFYLGYREKQVNGENDENATETIADFRVVVKGKGICKYYDQEVEMSMFCEFVYGEKYFILCIGEK